jgi:hypothetical protein
MAGEIRVLRCGVFTLPAGITLLSGMRPAEEFSTLVHEIAHLCGGNIYVALASG